MVLLRTRSGYSFNRKIFYGAKLHPHKDFIKKSNSLIREQRNLKTHLEKEGFEFIMSGNVRAQEITVGKEKKVIFREKGVDVKMAVDLVAMACDKKLDIAVICSSDAELKKRGVEVIYLGFETQPNKGLTYTTDRTILFRNSEITEACPQRKS